jgi:hypothetical protein
MRNGNHRSRLRADLLRLLVVREKTQLEIELPKA